MGLLLELIMNIIIFVTRPFSLFKILFLFGARTIWLIVSTWLQLVKGFTNFQAYIFWRIMMWTTAIVSLPVRIWSALQRERMLETLVREMQIELDSLAWDKKELEKRLQRAIGDCRVMESILTEIEEEHEKAIDKIVLLENELRDLKEENLRLNETQGKYFWDFKGQNDPRGGLKICDDEKCNSLEFELTSLDYKGSGIAMQGHLMHGDAWEIPNKGNDQLNDLLKVGLKANDPGCLFPPMKITKVITVEEAIVQHRWIALSRSVFSAILSLLVGMIIWESEDACMPLVLALFTVVGMSLKSVVQFFSTISNKPASDAVALLSLNWFILGTLTYPTLPKIAYLLTPMALSLADRTLSWLGLPTL